MTLEERQLLEEKYGGAISEAFEQDRKWLAEGKPLAYVIGSLPFLGLTIGLDSRPLIPRPETEWWTEQLIAKKENATGLCVLDLCAGSGAVGMALLSKLPDAQVAFAELIPEHAEQIRKNIAANALDASRSRVEISDLFSAYADERFDLIAANPSYIPEDRALDDSVAKWEPREALFAGIDGLELIRRIARETAEHMNPGGELWCEIDSEHAPEALRLFQAAGAKEAAVHNDQYGRPRIVVAYY